MKKDRSRKKNCIRYQIVNSKHFATGANAQMAHMVVPDHSSRPA
ncbi:hypothetical protein RISK_003114 [Rhodopirellula islandica]|uniref:Uncharacterized protein n=1 Tax=Rhodopirellula islandica TaxID=595434 RepID=A0A0J1BE76_RHOIS|nr:hypothetical protein RISK_003114 [Rhodopirellula islandica]